MSTSYGPESAGSLRIGDAERLGTVTALGDHFAAGRLDQNEFDERTAAAYAARTFADLDPLFADLPEPRPARPAYATPAPTGWPPPRSPASGVGWPPPGSGADWSPRGRGPAWRGAGMLPAVPFPLLLFGFLVLISLVGVVAFLVPFVLIPMVWLLFARGGRHYRRYGRHHWW